MRQGELPHAAANAIVRAERRPGAGAVRYDAVHAAEEAACNEFASLIDKVSLVPATKMRGLRKKAALAAKNNDADLAWSVIDDLNAVPDGS
jgi:hypothetical protein